MLSAFWGDLPDHHTAPKKGCGSCSRSASTTGLTIRPTATAIVIAWALHHRKWMTAIALLEFRWRHRVAQAKWGGTAFLPASDPGNPMIEVRTPPSSSVEYAKLRDGAEPPKWRAQPA